MQLSNVYANSGSGLGIKVGLNQTCFIHRHGVLIPWDVFSVVIKFGPFGDLVLFFGEDL